MVIPVVLLYRSSWETDSSYSDKVLECEGNSGEFVELVPEQLNYLGPKDLTQYFIRSTHCHTWKSSLRFGDNFAKDCLLTLVKSRLALGSPGCSSPCRKWPNTQENGCCLPPSDHIQSKILFQTKQDQERGMNGPASLLHS